MSSRQPQPRQRHAAVGFGSKLYVCGGFGSNSANIRGATLESFDVSSETWQQSQQLRGAGLPDGLWAMAATTDGENAYFFGGKTGTYPNYTFYNAIYKVSPSTLQCERLVPSSVPKKTSGCGMVYYNQKLVIHGGYTSEGMTDELYVFDLKTRAWSAQRTTGQKPPAVESHSFVKIDSHRAVVFGGYTGKTNLNDTYVLDMDTWTWTKLTISGRKPPIRSVHATCGIPGPTKTHVLVAGGLGEGWKKLGDIWLLDVDKREWSEVTSLPPRKGHSATVLGYGSQFKVVVFFGGFYEAPVSNTTLLFLELRGGSWRVTRVVKPDELGRSDERLREQMRKLELSPQKGTGPAQAKAPPTAPKPRHTSETDLKASYIMDVNEVQMSKRLGQGGFGAVYEAKWKKRRVAVKVCLGNLLQNLSREIQILSSLPPHSNVLTFYGVALSSDEVSTYMILELAPNGSLYDYLHVKKEEPSPDQSFAWALQVASGMQHLHTNNVVHRDLKSGNILLSFGMVAKVCDFGTARTLAKTAMTTQKGTYRWMAPEIVEGIEANINKMCDVFSFGMVVYEVFAHKIPYDDIPTDPLVGMAVLQGKRPPVPPTLPPFLHPLLEACWKKEPNQRPNFETIVMAMQTGCFE